MQDDFHKVAGWNWGAFLFTWIWGAANGIWISLFALIPGINLIIAIYLGANGSRLAWEKGRYISADNFKEAQSTWLKWGVAIYGILIIGGALTILLSAYFAKNEEQVMARDNQRIVDVQALASKASQYKLQHDGKCPASLENLVPDYLDVLPLDPEGRNYVLQSEGQTCSIITKLENPEKNPSSSESNLFVQQVEDLTDYLFFEE